MPAHILSGHFIAGVGILAAEGRRVLRRSLLRARSLNDHCISYDTAGLYTAVHLHIILESHAVQENSADAFRYAVIARQSLHRLRFHIATRHEFTETTFPKTILQ